MLFPDGNNAKVLLTFRKLISEAPLRQPFLILHEAVKVSAKTSQGSDDNSGHKHSHNSALLPQKNALAYRVPAYQMNHLNVEHTVRLVHLARGTQSGRQRIDLIQQCRFPAAAAFLFVLTQIAVFDKNIRGFCDLVHCLHLPA